MAIEKRFDVPFIAGLALREKQVQQNYRPIIAVHKWFARRPGTLFRGLLLSEFSATPLREAYFAANDFPGGLVADPFMGGGTPLIEANRLGFDVVGWDINPMAWWVVKQEIEHLDLAAYRLAAQDLVRWLDAEVGELYRTSCLLCGSDSARVKYFLWVKTIPCGGCGSRVDLFPGFLVAQDRRHPKHVFVCPGCGALNETASRGQPGACSACRTPLVEAGPASRSRCACSACGQSVTYPDRANGPLDHRLFAIEYLCTGCRPYHRGRFFKQPDGADLARVDTAVRRWQDLRPEFVPDDAIPAGDETDRLHRWGYRRYREMFNQRQLLGLELSCRRIAAVADERVRNALATNLSDLLRYQNMLCRYDTMALKSLDIFSVHGFPVGLVVCESNLLGITRGNGINVGSGGWWNIIEKFTKAKAYCSEPFEVLEGPAGKKVVPIPGEWIGERRNGEPAARERSVVLHAATATTADLPAGALDAVLTDPPYFGNVQYAELMDFCYVWLRRLARVPGDQFDAPSTRRPEELTGNVTMLRGLDHFAAGLAEVFARMARALKPGGPFVFTYHHNRLDAYHPVVAALLDAGLVCSATLPCPAEMGGSIHINRTGSSIVDSVFVCRSTGSVPRWLIRDDPASVARMVAADLHDLRAAGLKPTQGDIRCITYGHLARLAVWRLRTTWDDRRSPASKLETVAAEIAVLGGPEAIQQALGRDLAEAPRRRTAALGEDTREWGSELDEIPF